MPENPSIPVEHQNVPQAHQGLHGFLYSSDSEHSAPDAVISSELTDTADRYIPISEWQENQANTKIAGVYAVINSDRQVQYIGYSRNILLSLQDHISRQGLAACDQVRVQSFKFPKREEIEKLRDRWLTELDYIPVGNQAGQNWASTVKEAATRTMSEADRLAYEEKKLKLRKAMDDPDLRATSEADWSAVIASQTAATIEQ